MSHKSWPAANVRRERYVAQRKESGAICEVRPKKFCQIIHGARNGSSSRLRWAHWCFQFQFAAIPANEASAKQLADKIVDLSTEKPSEVDSPSKMAALISGKVYRFPPNEINLKSLSLILVGPQAQYKMEAYAVTQHIRTKIYGPDRTGWTLSKGNLAR